MCCLAHPATLILLFSMEKTPWRTRDGRCDHPLYRRQATCLPALSGLSPPKKTPTRRIDLYFIVFGSAPMRRLDTFTFTFLLGIVNSSNSLTFHLSQLCSALCALVAPLRTVRAIALELCCLVACRHRTSCWTSCLYPCPCPSCPFPSCISAVTNSAHGDQDLALKETRQDVARISYPQRQCVNSSPPVQG